MRATCSRTWRRWGCPYSPSASRGGRRRRPPPRRPPTPTRTYGHYRTEILAALINGAMLAAISIYVIVEACRRLAAPPEVNAPVMMAVAAGGLLFNLVGLQLLAAGRTESLNVGGAWADLGTHAVG